MNDPRTDHPEKTSTPGRKRGFLVALPLVIFGAVAGTFAYALHQNQLGRDITEIPSVLIDKPAPRTVLPPLEGVTGRDGQPVPGLDFADGDGRPVLVNVFASWCGPCRQEHPLLMELSEDERLRIVGINYKDRPENARGFIEALGNPYDAIGVDQSGAAVIDWGVYGVPESFLVSADGTIVYKQTGPFSEQNFRTGLLPALERLTSESEASPTS